MMVRIYSVERSAFSRGTFFDGEASISTALGPARILITTNGETREQVCAAAMVYAIKKLDPFQAKAAGYWSGCPMPQDILF